MFKNERKLSHVSFHDKLTMSKNQVIRPDVSPDQATKIASKLYDFKADVVKEYVSYSDRNFRLTSSTGTRSVLKISNLQQTMDLSSLSKLNIRA